MNKGPGERSPALLSIVQQLVQHNLQILVGGLRAHDTSGDPALFAQAHGLTAAG